MKITTFPQEENSVLGSCLISRDAASKVMQMMKVEYFSQAFTQKIFQLIKEIYENGHPVTRDSLRVHATQEGCYEKYQNEIVLLPTYAELQNLDIYMEKIRESHYKLRIAELVRRLSNNLERTAIDEIMETCSEYINDTPEQVTFSEQDILLNFEDGLPFDKVLQKRQESYNSGKKFSGYSTGFPRLDHAIEGLNKKHYIVIGGTPGSGKTTFAVQIVNNLEAQKIKVGILTLELSNSQFVTKLMSTRTGLSYSALMSGNFGGVQFQNCNNEMQQRLQSEKLLFFEEIPINSLSALKARIQRLIEVIGVQVLVIDYISLITHTGKGINQTESLTQISKTIKDLLKKYDIPGIVLVQLVKNVENSPPDKYHIKDASQIIQDAYEILMLWDPDQNSMQTGCLRRKLFIRKARFGPPGEIDFMFDGKTFYSTEEYHAETAEQIEEINEYLR